LIDRSIFCCGDHRPGAGPLRGAGP